MSRTLGSRRHEALRTFLIERRQKAGLTQAELAGRLKQYQSFIARIESGQRRIDVVELLELATALGFEPREALRRLAAIKQD